MHTELVKEMTTVGESYFVTPRKIVENYLLWLKGKIDWKLILFKCSLGTKKECRYLRLFAAGRPI